MSGSMDITTTSDNAESSDAAAAAPTKPSLRILEEAFTNLSTREEDLAHGHLLLGLGDGHAHVEDPHLSHPGLGLSSEESSHDSANEIILLSLPSQPSNVPLSSSAHAMTLSTISSGQLLTLPSSSITHESVYHPEEQTTLPSNQQRAVLPVPWQLEFSWENSHLCFDTEPLEIVKVLEEQSSKANQASESGASRASFSGLPAPLFGAGGSDPFITAGIGGFCSSAEGWPALSPLQDFEVALMASSASNDGSEFDNTKGDDYIGDSSHPMVAIAMEKKAEWIAEQLIDNFFRSYARQQSRKQTAAAKDQDLAREPGNKAQSFGGDRGHIKKSRKSRAAGRNEGSGDEDSGGDGQGPSRAAKSSDPLYLACPFLKWDPMRYAETCCLRFKQIRLVKRHLRDRHQENHCPSCEMIFKETNISTHECDPKRVLPRALLTKAKLLEIEAIRGSEVEWKKKQQWYRIFEIIFPNEPPCLSPYFNQEADKRLGEAEKYLCLPEVRALFHKTTESGTRESQVMRKFYKLLFPHIFPTTWGRFNVNEEGEPYMTQDKEHAAQHAQPSKTVDFGAQDTIISHDTGNGTSQHPHEGIAVPQSCAVTGSTDYPASMSELFAAQGQSENIASNFFPDLTNSGEFPDPARRGLMGLCGSGSWEMPVGQNFTDPFWSAGYEVGSDLMSEP